MLSDPDLPYRLQNNLELAPYDRSVESSARRLYYADAVRSTFYTQDRKGYTTYEAWSQPPTRPVSSNA
jgi:NADPH2 dehydrogenase